MRMYRFYLGLIAVGTFLLCVWGGCAQNSSVGEEKNIGQKEKASVEGTAQVEPVDEPASTDSSVVSESTPEPTPEPAVEKKPPAAPYKISLFDNIRINSRKEYNGVTYKNVRNAKVEF